MDTIQASVSLYTWPWLFRSCPDGFSPSHSMFVMPQVVSLERLALTGLDKGCLPAEEGAGFLQEVCTEVVCFQGDSPSPSVLDGSTLLNRLNAEIHAVTLICLPLCDLLIKVDSSSPRQ